MATTITYGGLSNATFLDYSSYQLASPSLFTAMAALPSVNLNTTDVSAFQSVLTQALFGSATPQSMSKTQSYPLAAVADATMKLNVSSLLYPFDPDTATVTVGLMVKRDADPTAMLSGNWASRQAALADQDAVWATYGGHKNYSAVQSGVEQALGVSNASSPTFLTAADGYNSSEQSRTIWLKLTPAQFKAVFNTDLLVYSGTNTTLGAGYQSYTWSGNLSLPTTIKDQVSGIWVDTSLPYGSSPSYTSVPFGTPTPSSTAAVPLSPNQQSPGNALDGNEGAGTGAQPKPTPTQVAIAYNFPLTGSTVKTADVGLVEATVLNSNLETYLNTYRTQVLGLSAYKSGQFQIVAAPQAAFQAGDLGEEALDVSIVAGAAPNSRLLYYAYAGGQTFVGYQNAIFDTGNRPHILSSSFTDQQRFSPHSPFAAAYNDVFVDAALRNMSVFLSSGDGGSGGEYGAGLPMGRPSHASPYAVIVGGASISNLQAAGADPTLAQLYSGGTNNDPATLMALTASGLKTLPQNMAADTFSIFVQTVWNTYYLLTQKDGSQSLSSTYLGNNASTGGIDQGTRVPGYQTAFGLTPTSAAPDHAVGRGLPDVSALAGGNARFEVLNFKYDGNSATSLTAPSAGTSAASPLWASLAAQIDTIFTDQGLPHLGYFNDLLYTAAAIAPGSFSDITIGNNISTYYIYKTADGAMPYVISESDGNKIGPTGLGYSAAPGYDQATGLGTPNGLLLARALTAIAHTQTGHAAQPDVVRALSETSAQSNSAQTLLVQATGALGSFELDAGGHAYHGTGDANALAWTDRLAQQSLQKDFDPALVRLLDGASQANPLTVHAGAGDALSSSVAGLSLGLYQADMTAPYGFVAFGGQSAGVTVARPVAVAETDDSGPDHNAIVRLRQNGADTTSLMLYKVDDLSGVIDGVAPGDPRYAALAAARAYHFADGTTQVTGPGYGNYAETQIQHVHQGDLVAMALVNGTHTYWAFADANESVGGTPTTHLWNYGLNSWGWEDQFGGGDRDYNDLIVQLDFTSLAGHGLIA